MIDEPKAPSDASAAADPYLPIAIGFWLLSLPLWVSILLAESAAGAWTNGLAAAAFVLIGSLLRRQRR